MSAVPPALVVDVLLALIVSQLCYAFFPYRRRAYVPALLLSALGIADVRIGSANLLPGVLFAVALQPLARYLPIRFP